MNEGDLIESEESQRRREAILVATRGAKRGWQNLAVVALQAAARWKRERDELLWLHAEAAWQRDEARNRFLDHYNATSDQMDRIASLEQELRDRVAERDGLQARITAVRKECAARIEAARTLDETRLPMRIQSLLSDPTAVHQTDDGDCLDDCTGCAEDRGEVAGPVVLGGSESGGN